MPSHEQLVTLGREIVQDAPQAFIDFDVESDGIAGYGSLLSLGAVSPWGEEFYAELRPASSKFVPSQRAFCDKLGLTRERLMDEGENPEVVMRNFTDWAFDLTKSHDKGESVLVSNPSDFDFAHVKAASYESGIIEDWPFGINGFCLDSIKMALPGRKRWDWANTSKRNLPAELFPPDPFSHHALEDAKYQQKMHFGMVALLGYHPSQPVAA